MRRAIGRTALVLGSAMGCGWMSAASADYTGAELEVVDVGAPAGQTTYRIYVTFDDPADQLLAISGNDRVSTLAFSTSTELANAGGALAGTSEEDFAAAPLSEPWDSWVTLDAEELAGNNTQYSPLFLGGDGTQAVIVGSSWCETNGGWSAVPPNIFAGPDLRVLIAQLTFVNEPDGSVLFTLIGTVDWQPGPGELTCESFAVGTTTDVGACCLPDGSCQSVDVATCATVDGIFAGLGVDCADADCSGACCLFDGTCVIRTPGGCTESGGTYTGGSCADAQCTGACCMDGTCGQTSAAQCAMFGGTYGGDGVACDDIVCGGACCLPNGGCVHEGPRGCAASGGLYAGDGSECEATDCSGACCLPIGVCLTLGAGGCAAQGGEYFGDGTECATVRCLGACCFGDGSCASITVQDCASQGGTFGGAMDCADAICTGACCLPDGCQEEVTFDDCSRSGGEFLGGGSVCSSGGCPGACCLLTGGCVVILPAACAANGGEFFGEGASCAGAVCDGACCLGTECDVTASAVCTLLGGLYQGNGTVCDETTCAPDVLGEIEIVDVGAPAGTTTYRAYLRFARAETQLLAFGTAVDGSPPFRFETNRGLVNEAGVLTGFKEEDLPAQPIAAPWDSFLTIGPNLSVGSDTDYTPGFLGSDGLAAVVVGSSLTDMSGGWFDSNPGTPQLAGPEMRLLIAQFTVENEPDGFSAVIVAGTAIYQDAPGQLMEQDCIMGTVFGACCFADDTCVLQTPDGCAKAGGTFQGVFTSCADGCARPPCVGDLEGDGAVGFYDLVTLLASWGVCIGCPADLVPDGVVNMEDLLRLLGAWGPCP